jgi:hypothetical protein
MSLALNDGALFISTVNTPDFCLGRAIAESPATRATSRIRVLILNIQYDLKYYKLVKKLCVHEKFFHP